MIRTIYFFIRLLFIFILLLCNVSKTKFVSDPISVEKLLNLKIPKNCSFVYFYSTNFINDEYDGFNRYYIRLENCNYFSDSINARFRLMSLCPSTLQENSKQWEWDNSGKLLSFYASEYSSERLWQYRTSKNINDTLPIWWTPDTTRLTNNYANYLIINDSIATSRKDSIWNGKIVLQKVNGNIYIYIETVENHDFYKDDKKTR